MTIKENVSVYKCDHCKKKLFVKGAMERHEKWCNSNPENFKKCSGCVHIEETTVEYEVWCGEADHYSMRKAKTFNCKKLNQLMYPLKAEQKGLVEKYPGTFEDQMPMPKECEHFKSEFDIEHLFF